MPHTHYFEESFRCVWVNGEGAAFTEVKGSWAK